MLRSVVRLAVSFALVAVTAPSARAAEERVSLVPERAPPWRASRVLDSLRDGARGPRELRIETSPAGARLEFAYVREGAEVARAAGVAPLVALLPGRALVGAGDRVALRAELPGFAPATRSLDPARLGPRMRIELSPLPRKLLAASLLELGGRARFVLLSDRALEARLTEFERGSRLVISNVRESGELAARLAEIRGASLTRVAVRPLGEDLIVELIRAPGDSRAPRIARRDDAVLAVSSLALEWLPGDGGAAALREAERALEASARAALGACAGRFERALAESLDAEALARSLAPSGAFTDAYVALALDQLAAHSPGRELVLRDGSHIALDGEAARAMARTRAADVRGTLAAVRSIAAALAPPGASQRALHAWLAPELAPAVFDAAYADAARSEARCGARSH